ncbi:hypothetical protein TOTORO_02810 [Serratia phage vB_SmaS-Totoro]|nr:hypothetical protein TOTORO_02810 [Serratia phage vB_SmaS-Totoro]
MPQLALPIPDIYASVTRPVNVSIIRSIMNVTGIKEDTFIEFSGENESVPTWLTTLNQKEYSEPDTAKFPFYQKIKVDYQEEVNDDPILSTAYHYNDLMLAWADTDRNITVSPFREQVKATLNFTYRTVDKNAAQNWRTMMRRKIMRHFIDETFNAPFHYVLPVQVMAMLAIFHEMKEKVAGDGDEFHDYLKSHAIADMTTMVDNAGKNETYVFRENQLDILGNFEFSAPPIEEKLPDGNCYDISFSYRFSYDRPIGMVVKYPLVVHNQLIPPGLRKDRGLYSPADFRGLSSGSTRRYYEMFQKFSWSRSEPLFNIIPFYDDWIPTQIIADVSPIAQFLIRVDSVNPKKVINLRELGKNKFDDKFLEYIKDQRLMVPRVTGCAAHIAVYENDRPIDQRDIFIDEDLNVWCQHDLDVKKLYHVRVGVFTQLLNLQLFAARYLQDHPDVFNMIIDALDPEFVKNGGTYPTAVNGKFVRISEYFRVARELRVTAERFFSITYKSIILPTVLGYHFQTVKE